MLPCSKCAYRREIPGDAHIQCRFDWALEPNTLVEIVDNCPNNARRWFLFPLNYDPVWGPDECVGQAETADPQKIMPDNPLMTLLGMLR